MVIDPSHHVDGQKAGVQIDSRVGNAAGLLHALAEQINTDATEATPYIIEVAPIFNADSFWKFARDHKNGVTSVTFDLITPNGPWGARDSLREDLKDFRAKENADEVVITIKAAEGINTETERVREAVKYAESGGGKIRARSNSGKHYVSTMTARTASVPASETENEALVHRARRLVQTILGRNE